MREMKRRRWRSGEVEWEWRGGAGVDWELPGTNGVDGNSCGEFGGVRNDGWND